MLGAGVRRNRSVNVRAEGARTEEGLGPQTPRRETSQVKGPRRNTKGFTLIEILIVVLIIGILLGIAVPNFIRAQATTKTKACISNMRMIDSAKLQWAIENGKPVSSKPTAEELVSYLGCSDLPICPEGTRAYVIRSVDTQTVCPNVGKYPDHVQP
jgi:prepilin-type N-terminal cleavage/methylation domain-containing protein